jgi:hypothetical protein
MNKAFLTFLAVGCFAGTAQAADVDITYGRFSQIADIIVSQLMTIKNNGAPIKGLEIECGFLQGTKLLATGRASAHNIDTGQTIYMSIPATVEKTDRADRADCRISDIDRK